MLCVSMSVYQLVSACLGLFPCISVRLSVSACRCLCRCLCVCVSVCLYVERDRMSARVCMPLLCVCILSLGDCASFRLYVSVRVSAPARNQRRSGLFIMMIMMQYERPSTLVVGPKSRMRERRCRCSYLIFVADPSIDRGFCYGPADSEATNRQPLLEVVQRIRPA